MRESLTVALPDTVDASHGPVPTNHSERLLFRQVYPTLVRVDCQGNVRPGLAMAWSADTAGRTWTFTLGDSAAGSRILSSWRERVPAIRQLGIEAETIGTDGRLRVTTRDTPDSVPALFAHPVLAGSRETFPRPWRAIGAIDPRDALDRGADLLVTSDPALVEYAAGKPGLSDLPLPWSRTYVLMRPAGAPPLRSSVGRDAVRAEARPAQPPFWWDQRSTCRQPAPRTARSTSSRVVYLRGDPIARGLAERIVALASERTDLRAAGLTAAKFSAALASGAEAAYVVALGRRSLAPCHDSAGWPAGATLLPLIDTRDHAIVREGTPSLALDWDGTIRLGDEPVAVQNRR